MNQAEMLIMLTEMEMQARECGADGVRSADRDLFVDSIDDADESSDEDGPHNQAKTWCEALSNWTLKFVKSVDNFDAMKDRLKEFIELHSDKNLIKFRQPLKSNRPFRALMNSYDKVAFAKFYTSELQAKKLAMKFDHKSYKVPMCEYCDGKVCRCDNIPCDMMMSTQSISRNKSATYRNFIIEFCNKIAESEEGLDSNNPTSMIKFEKMLIAKIRFHFWYVEMTIKEIKFEAYLNRILRKAEQENRDDGDPPKNLTSSEFQIWNWYDFAKSFDCPCGMTPMASAWFFGIVGAHHGDAREFDGVMSDIYPELDGKNLNQSQLAQKHVYQYFVRRDSFCDALVLIFGVEQRIRNAKMMTAKSSNDSPEISFLCDPTLVYEVFGNLSDHATAKPNRTSASRPINYSAMFGNLNLNQNSSDKPSDPKISGAVQSKPDGSVQSSVRKSTVKKSKKKGKKGRKK